MALLSLAVQAKPPDRNLIGTWEVTQVLDAQQTASISDEDAEKLVGARLIIGPDHIRFAGADCVHPSVTVARRRFYSHFIRNYNFEPKGIPLPDVVSEVTVTCREPVGIDFIYVRDSRQVVVYWEGFFLNAVRR
jgi:hypothetical protein